MAEQLGARSNTAKINKALKATGRTISDVEFEARAALSAAKLREAILRQAPVATEAEVADYYRSHRALFRPERRVVDLIEQLKSRPAAAALGSSLGPGPRFAKRAIHETVVRPTPQEEKRNFNGSLVHAIFAAPLHIVAPPVSYLGLWVVFVVRNSNRVVLRLPEATHTIAERLLTAHQQDALNAFAMKYQREWRARTTCRPGFIVPKCSESARSLQDEADPLSGAQ
jgi:hypothetical protein